MFMGTTLWEECGTSLRSDSALCLLVFQSKLLFLITILNFMTYRPFPGQR